MQVEQRKEMRSDDRAYRVPAPAKEGLASASSIGGHLGRQSRRPSLAHRRHRREPRVAVIGAGCAGIATAYKLKRAGINRFTVFEQSPEAGGTWYDNNYPGCEVDVPSTIYSFSFSDWDWSRTHAKQPEIKAYLDHTIDRFGLRPHFRFGVRVTGAKWDDSRRHYEVRLANGECHIADAVITGVGLLNNPKYPDWPGLDDFSGIVFHTSRWEHQHDLAGKRIGFAGTGSTGAQAVPELAKVADRLFVFQREPGWVFPKGERDYTPLERFCYRWSAVYRKFLRARGFFRIERYRDGLVVGTETNRQFHETALKYIGETIADPQVRSAVTPDFPVGCKRTVLSSTYFEALNLPNVTLIPHAVDRLTSTAVVTADGAQHDLDVLILGTGFQSQNYLATIDVTGQDGRRLADVWSGSPRAFCGVTVPGFPNFFMLYGPNTNGGGSIIHQLERASELAVRMVGRLAAGATTIETRSEAYERYNRWLDRLSGERLAPPGTCHNYYYAGGRNVTQFPLSSTAYRFVTLALPYVGIRAKR
jgi:cation diffusion facilitator CzcD-associated flavoprotein CzcO